MGESILMFRRLLGAPGMFGTSERLVFQIGALGTAQLEPVATSYNVAYRGPDQK